MLYIALVVFAGCVVALQPPINAALGRTVGLLESGLVSFAVGTLALWIYSLVTRQSWPGISEIAATPWWLWIGGLFGTVFVTCTIMLGPKLGAATMTAFMLLGQLAVSVILDHFALVGFPEHPASLLRLLGVAMLFGGAVLVRIF